MRTPLDPAKGFSVTLRHLFRKPVTEQYPEYKRPVYPRFRGRHRLHRHENGLEKCIGCSLCAAACPADCIRVVADENDPQNRVSPGERYARIYEINMARCIFCGYCEIACPFDAITLGNDYELSEISRDALIYTKEMLLEPPVRRTPAQDPDEFDRGAQEDLSGGVLGMYQVFADNAEHGAQVVTAVIFYLAGAAALGSAVAVVTQRNPFLAALALILHLAALATLFLVLQADFLAAAQVLVYAGAVMIMFLFVIAYLGDRAELELRRGSIGAALAIAAGAAILIESVIAVSSSSGILGTPADGAGQLRLARERRAGVLHELPGRVRARLDRAARRRGRRRGARRRAAPARPPGGLDARQAGARERAGRLGGLELSPGLSSWIMLSAALFAVGLVGVMLRRSPLVILLSIEIMLNAGNLLLIAASRYAGGNDGQVFALVVMGVAASEVVVGLGLIVALSRARVELDVDELRSLRG